MTSSQDITRQIMDNVPGWLGTGFYVAAFTALAIAASAIVLRLHRHRKAKAAAPRPKPGRSLGAALISLLLYLTFHRQLLRDRYAGIAHLLMFYGFVILFIGTCLVFLEHDTPLHFFYGRFYLVASLVIDLGGVAFVIGLTMFLLRRLRGATTRILRQWWVLSLSVLLWLIGVTGFLLEGARIAVDMPAHETWSVVGYAVASTFRAAGVEGDAARTLHRWMWGGHAALCVTFFALLPWKFFGHMVYGAASWATRTRRPMGMLRFASSPTASPGAATWPQMSRRDLLQADACTTCGRCNAVCPAAAAEKPLRPRDVVLNLRRAMDRGDDTPSESQVLVADDVLWSCTTCGACNAACPVGIEVFDKIVELRRGRVEAGVVPEPAEQVFESTAARFNPFGKPNADRVHWAQGLDVPVAKPDEPIELLYWVGCAGSFDPDGQSVARAMVKILNQLGVAYRILGGRERCTGDPARRLGEEGLFLELARNNIAQLKSHSVRHVLTHCPHCFNTFRNEYPQLDGTFQVEHHSQWLSRQIAAGRIKLPREMHGSVVFHDPCYLGRVNDETAAPRDVLLSLPQLQLEEMPRHGRDSFCCGAGGGGMWLDVKGSERIENLRAREAADTGASTVATGCPFCKSMLTAGCQSLNGRSQAMRVRDLAELVVEAAGW